MSRPRNLQILCTGLCYQTRLGMLWLVWIFFPKNNLRQFCKTPLLRWSSSLRVSFGLISCCPLHFVSTWAKHSLNTFPDKNPRCNKKKKKLRKGKVFISTFPVFSIDCLTCTEYVGVRFSPNHLKDSSFHQCLRHMGFHVVVKPGCVSGQCRCSRTS